MFCFKEWINTPSREEIIEFNRNDNNTGRSPSPKHHHHHQQQQQQQQANKQNKTKRDTRQGRVLTDVTKFEELKPLLKKIQNFSNFSNHTEQGRYNPKLLVNWTCRFLYSGSPICQVSSEIISLYRGIVLLKLPI